MNIVYFGTPEFSAYILEKLIKFCEENSKFIVQTAVTRAKDESPVALVARKHNIPVLKPEKLDEEFITTNYELLTTDLIIVASYGKIIPQTILDIPKLGSLNVHPSLLPKYRGPSPILTPILNGDKETGVTIMLMDAEMDHGPLLSAKKISISEKDNHQILTTKLAQVAAPLLIETLTAFVEGNIKPRPQNHIKATFCKMTKKEDGYFDIDIPPSSKVLDRMIRAYYPWPGVWTTWKEKIVKFYPDGKIQMEGKKIMPMRDFLNGYPDFPLKLLLSK